MTTEDKLRNLILTKYKSVREFTQLYEIPYSTMSTLFVRGINSASITTVIKVCQALGISTDELIAGRITYINQQPEPTKVEDIFQAAKQKLQNTDDLTLDGKTVDTTTIQTLCDALDVILEIEKRK